MLDRSSLDIPYTQKFWVSSCHCKDKLSEYRLWERESEGYSVDGLGSHFMVGAHGFITQITIII